MDARPDTRRRREQRIGPGGTTKLHDLPQGEVLLRALGAGSEVGTLADAGALFGQSEQVQVVRGNVGAINRSHRTPPAGCGGGSGCAACGS